MAKPPKGRRRVPLNERRGATGRFVTCTVHLFSSSYLARALILAADGKSPTQTMFQRRLMHPLFRRPGDSLSREDTLSPLFFVHFPPLFTHSPSLFPLRVSATHPLFLSSCHASRRGNCFVHGGGQAL